MLKLKEIIWEITTKCMNGCEYCGSAHSTSANHPDAVDIFLIAKAIAAYPPESVNISGGDPTLVDVDIHTAIVNIFRKARIQPKIIVNPLSINKVGITQFNNVIKLYDAVGMSINNEAEYDAFVNNRVNLRTDNITFISNFNKGNLWFFDELFTLAESHNCHWQVMLTMFKTFDPTSIYESEMAIEAFKNKVHAAQRKYSKVIIADNINTGECTAGINTLGILANGDVIPCLSMRAWTDNLDPFIQGTIRATDDGPDSLKYIWENAFKGQRFSRFYSCKDHCRLITIGAPPELDKVCGDEESIEDVIKKQFPDMPKMPELPEWSKPYPDFPPVMVYGVFTQPTGYPGNDYYVDKPTTCTTGGVTDSATKKVKKL